jgi:ATP-binding protein involved in chromosome partitioning
MARRSFVRVVGVVENMTDFTCEHGGTYPLFGAGGGVALADAIGVPLLGQVPLEAAVSAGGDAGRPVALATGDDAGPAAQAFEQIAVALETAAPPPSTHPDGPDMASCSARLLAAVEVALDAPVRTA